MSERGQQLYTALKKLQERQVDVFPAIVKSINGATIDVEVDGLLYEGVQLQAIESEVIKGILITPSIDSVVIIQRIMNSNDFSVIMYSNVKELIHETGNAKVLINDDGVGIYAGGENLLDILIDFADACTTERHLTKSGPTINISAESKLRFEEIKNRLKTLLQNA